MILPYELMGHAVMEKSTRYKHVKVNIILYYLNLKVIFFKSNIWEFGIHDSHEIQNNENELCLVMIMNTNLLIILLILT